MYTACHLYRWIIQSRRRKIAAGIDLGSNSRLCSQIIPWQTNQTCLAYGRMNPLISWHQHDTPASECQQSQSDATMTWVPTATSRVGLWGSDTVVVGSISPQHIHKLHPPLHAVPGSAEGNCVRTVKIHCHRMKRYIDYVKASPSLIFGIAKIKTHTGTKQI